MVLVSSPDGFSRFGVWRKECEGNAPETRRSTLLSGAIGSVGSDKTVTPFQIPGKSFGPGFFREFRGVETEDWTPVSETSVFSGKTRTKGAGNTEKQTGGESRGKSLYGLLLCLSGKLES